MIPKPRIISVVLLTLFFSVSMLFWCSLSDVCINTKINNLGINNYLPFFYVGTFFFLLISLNWRIFINTVNVMQLKLCFTGVFLGVILNLLLSFSSNLSDLLYGGPYITVGLLLGSVELNHLLPGVTKFFTTQSVVVPFVYGFLFFITRYLYDIFNFTRPPIRILVSSIPSIILFIGTIFYRYYLPGLIAHGGF